MSCKVASFFARYRVLHRALFILSVLIFCITLYKQKTYLADLFTQPVSDGDNYFGLFQKFLQQGYWQATAEGTSVFFNLCLSLIYSFVQDTTWSFFVLNAASLLVSTLVSFYLIKRIVRSDLYAFVLIVLSLSLLLHRKIPILSNDDLFNGMLFSLIVYCLYQYGVRRNAKYFVAIGVLLGLGLSVRELAVLWLPLIGMFILYYAKRSVYTIFRLCSAVGVPALLVVGMLHFPSIWENGRLSYYDKSPEDKNLSWIQRNYLGLKKVEEGKVPRRPWAIWRGTTFDEVAEYLATNGNDSLPRTYTEAFRRDPALFFKIALYNMYSAVKYYLAAFGFLILLPLWLLFATKKLGQEALVYSFAFAVFTVMICTLAYSFVEFRWFSGIETILVVAIALSTYHFGKSRALAGVYLLSLLFVLSNLILNRI